jgi:hypothetical protein
VTQVIIPFFDPFITSSNPVLVVYRLKSSDEQIYWLYILYWTCPHSVIRELSIAQRSTTITTFGEARLFFQTGICYCCPRTLCPKCPCKSRVLRLLVCMRTTRRKRYNLDFGLLTTSFLTVLGSRTLLRSTGPSHRYTFRIVSGQTRPSPKRHDGCPPISEMATRVWLIP